MDTTLARLKVGQVLDGRYRVDARIARGGMATVYLGTDTRLERTVALKIAHPELAHDADFVRRFIAEARSVARLSSPNVVAVYDQGAEGDILFLAMEYVPGRTLRELLTERGKLSPGEALDIIEGVLTGLAAAHAAGVVHRDVKPENVLITPGHAVKVADFGLARAVAMASHTKTGTIIGTAAYLAPEQVSRSTSDSRTDVYATGVMLFELLTGRQPHTGETPLAVAYKHVNEVVPAPSGVMPGLPAALDALVALATSRNPDLRPADAGQFLRAITEVRRGLPVTGSRAADLPAGAGPGGGFEPGSAPALPAAGLSMPGRSVPGLPAAGLTGPGWPAVSPAGPGWLAAGQHGTPAQDPARQHGAPAQDPAAGPAGPAAREQAGPAAALPSASSWPDSGWTDSGWPDSSGTGSSWPDTSWPDIQEVPGRPSTPGRPGSSAASSGPDGESLPGPPAVPGAPAEPGSQPFSGLAAQPGGQAAAGSPALPGAATQASQHPGPGGQPSAGRRDSAGAQAAAGQSLPGRSPDRGTANPGGQPPEGWPADPGATAASMPDPGGESFPWLRSPREPADPAVYPTASLSAGPAAAPPAPAGRGERRHGRRGRPRTVHILPAVTSGQPLLPAATSGQPLLPAVTSGRAGRSGRRPEPHAHRGRSGICARPRRSAAHRPRARPGWIRPAP